MAVISCLLPPNGQRREGCKVQSDALRTRPTLSPSPEGDENHTLEQDASFWPGWGFFPKLWMERATLMWLCLPLFLSTKGG